jgi:hypothetical protein
MLNLRCALITALTLVFSHAARAQGYGAFPPDVRGVLHRHFTLTGPRPGEAAPDFRLRRPDGGTIQASELWAKKPVLLMTGSYSCPIFRESTESRRALREKYADRIEFVIVYVIEAHPAGEMSPYSMPGDKGFTGAENKRDGISVRKPATYAERISSARRCKDALKVKSIIAVDTLENSVWTAYGSSPNCAYLIGTDGKVIAQQGIFYAEDLEPVIKKLLGEK